MAARQARWPSCGARAIGSTLTRTLTRTRTRTLTPTLTSTLTLARCPGDWVEFALVDGTLRATDYAGQTFVWGTRVAEGEVWVPTVAWTGSRASILLAPPAL